MNWVKVVAGVVLTLAFLAGGIGLAIGAYDSFAHADYVNSAGFAFTSLVAMCGVALVGNATASVFDTGEFAWGCGDYDYEDFDDDEDEDEEEEAWLDPEYQDEDFVDYSPGDTGPTRRNW